MSHILTFHRNILSVAKIRPFPDMAKSDWLYITNSLPIG